jgi:lipopolysaccharide/colanic/teichoic acid biosynthesis glycosyltransferase/glycosyltransferase involved in cell wall biosynthesis
VAQEIKNYQIGQGTRILMVVKNNPFKDSRVKKEVRSLLNRGAEIDIIGVCRERKSPQKLFGRASFYPLFIAKGGTGTGKIIEFFSFLSLATIRALSLFLSRRYQIIHLHTPPDFLILLGVICKYLFKTKIVADIHDLSPEFYYSLYQQRGATYRLLLFFEKLLLSASDALIVTNQSYHQLLADRHQVHHNKFFIIKNYPNISDFHIFKKAQALRRKSPGQKILLYLGALNPQDGVLGLVDSVRAIVNDREKEDLTCWIVGEGEQERELKKYVENLGLKKHFKFWGGIWDRKELATIVKTADICLEPAPDNRLNRKSTFIKIFEYMLAGKPIVSYQLKETINSAQGSSLYADPALRDDFSQKILALLNSQEQAQQLSKIGLERSQQLLWEFGPEQNLVAAYQRVLPQATREEKRLSLVERMIIRFFDITLSLIGLLLLWPLFLLISILIKLDSAGPAIFVQERVGLNQKLFAIYKFRTMIENAEEEMPPIENLPEPNIQVIKNDPRQTNFGHFLRKRSLDELPQLVNVLRGEMSLVGPRPLIKKEVDLFPQSWKRRFLVKPGLTGWAQVSGRSDLSVEEAVRLDLAYLKRQGLVSYLGIIIRTVVKVIKGQGAI